MEAFGMKQKELARQSGVTERMIAYIIKQERTATINLTESLAKPFGLNGWHLLIPNLPVDLAKNGKLAKLLSNYALASDDGRQYIDKIAEREADYKTRAK